MSAEAVTRCSALMLGLLLSAAAVACEAAWNLASRDGLKRDIVQLFQTQNIPIANPDCRMLGTSRDGICGFALSPADAAAAVKGLRLHGATRQDLVPGLIDTVEAPPERGCRSLAEFDKPSTLIYESGRRAKELRLPGGSQFEYLLLYVQPANGQACIQAAYSYG